MNLITRACPVCASAHHGPLRAAPVYTREYRDHGPTVVRCRDCGHVYLNPLMDADGYRAFYDADEQRAFVAKIAVEDYLAKTRRESERRLAMVSPFLNARAVLIDVGCGYGSFLEHVAGRVHHAIGVEPSASRAASCQTRGLDVRHGTVEHLSIPEAADVVTLFQVLEHVVDPIPFLRRIRELLAPGGRIVIEVPNHEDLLVASKKYQWFYYQNAHVSYYDQPALTRVIEAAGLTVNGLLPLQRYSLDNHLHWWLAGRPGRLRLPGWLVAAYRSWIGSSRRRDTLFVVCEDTL